MECIVLVNPFRCRVWKLHDRLEEMINETTCRDEIESFHDHGQLVPVLGRRLLADPDFDIELIYGARRLFVARLVGMQLKVEIRDISDREAIIAMDLENRQRKDISPYERGLSYVRWLRGGYFASQEDIARALKVSASQISRLAMLARLPSVIVNAFGSPAQICEGWGQMLTDALADPGTRRSTIRAAREVAAVVPRPAAKDVYRQLVAASAPGRKIRPEARDRVVKSKDGQPLFRVRYHRDSVALVMPVGKVSASSLERIEAAVSAILQSPGAAPPLINSSMLRPAIRQVSEFNG